MKKLNVPILLLSAVLLGLSGCSYRTEKKSRAPLPQLTGSGVGFAEVSKSVFQPRCSRCHGNAGGISLATYETVRANLPLIQEVLENGSMPPRGPLATEESALVLEWIRNGAPEVGAALREDAPAPAPAPGPAPEPAPEPEPEPQLEAKFSSIYTNILEPKCIGCHSATGRASFLLLDSLEALRAVEEKSELIARVQPDAPKLMPPTRTKIPPLNPEQVQIFTRWIELEMPE